MRFEIAVVRWRGGRPYQEDSFRVCDLAGHPVLTKGDGGNPAADFADDAVVDRGMLVVVADGMGGHGGGDVASRVAADGFVQAFFAEREASITLPDGKQHNGELGRLGNALDKANLAIDAEVRARPELGDMGCTLIAGHLEAGQMHFCSVGDSLILRLRKNELHRVNADHSYARILEAQAVLSNDASLWHLAHASPDRNAITSALQGRRVELIELDERLVEDGDILLFASDGLETLDYEQVRTFVHATRDSGVRGIADGLKHAIDHFGENRRQDNTTIVVIRAVTAKPSHADTVLPPEMPMKVAEAGSEPTRVPTAPGALKTAVTRPPVPAEALAAVRPLTADETPTAPPRAPMPAPAAAGEEEPSIPRTQVQSLVPRTLDPARAAPRLAAGGAAAPGRAAAAAAQTSPQAAANRPAGAAAGESGSGSNTGLVVAAGAIVVLIIGVIVYFLASSFGLFSADTAPPAQVPVSATATPAPPATPSTGGTPAVTAPPGADPSPSRAGQQATQPSQPGASSPVPPSGTTEQTQRQRITPNDTPLGALPPSPEGRDQFIQTPGPNRPNQDPGLLRQQGGFIPSPSPTR